MEDKIKDTILNYKSYPNKDLEMAMKSLKENFDETKDLIIRLTHHLDGLEKSYNNILSEYQNRTKIK
jgi:prefoldin subunit 5